MKCAECRGAGKFAHCISPECRVPDETCDVCFGEGVVCDECEGAFTRGETGPLCVDCIEAHEADAFAFVEEAAP